VIGVATCSTKLVEQVSNDQKKRNDIEQHAIDISFFDSSSLTESTHQSLGSNFMWFQLIVEVLLRMDDHSTNLTFIELLETCLEQYAGNETNLEILFELGTEYDHKKAVWWYSRQTFIYQILNCALRRQDLDVLVRFCFLICDLYKQLKTEQKFDQPVVHVYRGQLMFVNELERLRTSKKRFISINTFFSTTRNRQLALIFAGADNTDPEKVSILFDIQANTKLQSAKPFASIGHLSQFGDTEEEVLFMLGSIFKILSITWEDIEKVWTIKLELAGEEENELKSVFESMKKEIEPQTGLLSLGNILKDMGKYNEAEKYYKKILNSLPEGNLNISACYNNLGNISLERGDYDNAHSNFLKALDLELKLSDANQNYISDIYVNIGLVLTKKQDYKQALENLSKALSIKLKTVGRDHLKTAIVYERIGLIYKQQKNDELALSNMHECLNIQLKLLPENHPEIALTLMNIGLIQRELENYSLSMEMFERALSIQLACIPNHVDTGRTYFNIGALYAGELDNCTDALVNFEKALKIYQDVLLPANHPEIINTQDCIIQVKDIINGDES
jgi:tetratricopeptide (TPR) repeat protein